MQKNIPINKGNYSLDTKKREDLFNKNRAFGVEQYYYENRRQWQEYPQKQFVAEYPLLVDIELSSVCNLKCPFCYTITEEFKQKVNTKLMDFDLFKKIIDEIGEKVFAIRLSLRGEPTLHPKFIEAIQYAKAKGIKEVSTLTNLSKMTPEYFEKCLLAGIDWITVSFDGLYQEYEKNRFPLKFEESYNKLKQMQEIKQKYNSPKPVIKVQAVWPSIEKNADEFLDKMSKVSDLVAFNPIIDFAQHKPESEIVHEDNFICCQPYQRLVIGADGLAMICSNDEENKNIIGDANHQSIYIIWHGEKATYIRQEHKKQDGFKNINICRQCYIPRKTREDVFQLKDRKIIVKNYI